VPAAGARNCVNAWERFLRSNKSPVLTDAYLGSPYAKLLELRAVSDDWDSLMPPNPTRGIIGQITHHLDHMAEMLHAIDEYDELNYHHHHHRRIAFVGSFLLDFRALYYFLLGPGSATDAHRFDFVDIRTWQRPRTDATKRMDKLVLFISKYRAHLSKSRFDPPYQSLEDWIDVSNITAEYLGRVLLDYLDVLDEFIDNLSDTKVVGKGFWQGAAFSARYKTEVALGVRQSDYPDALKPLKSVQARQEPAN
jgi:hypothetical protein